MASVEKTIEELAEFSQEELQRLRQAVDERLAWEEMDEEQKEEAFIRTLLKKGVISSIPDRSASTPEDQRPAPIAIEGEPLSEQIIRERR